MALRHPAFGRDGSQTSGLVNEIPLFFMLGLSLTGQVQFLVCLFLPCRAKKDTQ